MGRMRVFENRVLRRIFKLKRDKVTGGWRKLHYLYSLSNIIRIIKLRMMQLVRHVARMGAKRNVYRLLVEKREGKRSLGRPRHRWVDNIKMFLVKIVLGALDWIGVA
jgi:hypothetical protein